MKTEKRQEKENAIIDAAESVFSSVGFKNAKMEDIASAGSITKVTLYSYFQSKENLYLAVTHRALKRLTDGFYDIVEQKKGHNGLEVVLNLIDYFMEFCSANYLYSEALIDYFVMNRSSAAGTDTSKLTDAVIDSNYYRRIQDIQNLPFKIIAKAVSGGQEDKSIISKIDPMLFTLHSWTNSLGYVKIMRAGTNTRIFNTGMKELKDLKLHLLKQILLGRVDEQIIATDSSLN